MSTWGVKITVNEESLGTSLRGLLSESDERVSKAPKTSGDSIVMKEALKKAGEIVRRAIIDEAKRGFVKLERNPNAWKHLCELDVRIIGNTIEVFGKLFINDSTVEEFERKRRADVSRRSSKKETGTLTGERDRKTGPGALDENRGTKRGTGKFGATKGPKIYPMQTKEGIVILRAVPLQTKELWFHPIMADNGFVRRGVEKSWGQAWDIIQRAMKG